MLDIHLEVKINDLISKRVMFWLRIKTVRSNHGCLYAPQRLPGLLDGHQTYERNKRNITLNRTLKLEGRRNKARVKAQLLSTSHEREKENG